MAILNLQLAINTIGHWNPNSLAFITKIDYRADKKSPETNSLFLGGIMQPRKADLPWLNLIVPKYYVEFQFRNVRDLRLVMLSGGLLQITGFDIQDVADRG